MVDGTYYRDREAGTACRRIAKAVDTTEATEGRTMVIYTDIGEGVYVKEIKEFNEKFEPITEAEYRDYWGIDSCPGT